MISAEVSILSILRTRKQSGRPWSSTASPWTPLRHRFSSFRLVEEI